MRETGITVQGHETRFHIRSHIRMSQSTATSPLVPRSRDLFRVLSAKALVSPVLTQLRLVKAPFKRGSLTASCAVSCNKRSGGKNEKRDPDAAMHHA